MIPLPIVRKVLMSSLVLRRAKESDLKELFDLINLSYDVERGNDGLAFKNTDRFKTVDSFRKLVGNTWVVRDNSSEKRSFRGVHHLSAKSQ